MRRTCVTRKVRRSPKLRGVQRSPELFARSTDSRVPETLISWKYFEYVLDSKILK